MPVKSDRHKLNRDLDAAVFVTQVIQDDSTILANELAGEMELDVDESDDDGEAEMQRMTDELYNTEDELMDIREIAGNLRYHESREKMPHKYPFDIDDVLRLRPYDFRAALRTTPACFQALLNLIGDHPVFQSTSRNKPPPPEHQLAITLERLGSNGNGASVSRLARYYKVSLGAVINCTRRVLTAIKDCAKGHLAWPSKRRRKRISAVMSQEGFPGCVGFVDGTTFPLMQKPGKDGEVFWDRKKQYSINGQIVCDCDRRITAIYVGWPGSCSDTTVYGKMPLAVKPRKFFSDGERFFDFSKHDIDRNTFF